MRRVPSPGWSRSCASTRWGAFSYLHDELHRLPRNGGRYPSFGHAGKALRFPGGLSIYFLAHLYGVLREIPNLRQATQAFARSCCRGACLLPGRSASEGLLAHPDGSLTLVAGKGRKVAQEPGVCSHKNGLRSIRTGPLFRVLECAPRLNCLCRPGKVSSYPWNRMNLGMFSASSSHKDGLR